MIDLWTELRAYFEDEGDDYPEIDIINLSEEHTRKFLLNLLLTSQQCTTSFILPVTRTEVHAPSPISAAKALSRRAVIGVIWFDLPALPTLGVFVDRTNRLSLSYTPGDDWTPMQLLALFGLLQDVYTLDETAEITLSEDFFDAPDRQKFKQIVDTYMTEKVK